MKSKKYVWVKLKVELLETKDDYVLVFPNLNNKQVNISKYDRTRLALKKEEILKPIAKANQGKRNDLVQKSGRSDSKKVDKVVAKIAKVSHDTVAKVKYIEQKAGKYLHGKA